jgi:hypothetical protein
VPDLFALLSVEILIAQPDVFAVLMEGIMVPGMRPGTSVIFQLDAELQNEL